MRREKGPASPNGERSRLWISAIREAIDYEYMKWDDHDYRPLRLHDGDFWQTPRSDNFLAEIAVYRVKATKQHAVSRENSVRCPAAAEQVSHESSRLRWSLYTVSDAAIDLISAWLQQCTNGHEICQKNFSDHVPSRLLDPDGGLDAADIRLVLASDIGAQPYVTLSYTWGTSTTVSLTEDLIEAFQTSIPVMTLPKPIRDAIKVCRMLQVRFLWVDALCIIQNSSRDFAQEVSQMGSIHGNSLLTIAASDTADCNKGFLVARYPLQTEDCQILDDGENIELFAGTVHAYLSHYHD